MSSSRYLNRISLEESHIGSQRLSVGIDGSTAGIDATYDGERWIMVTCVAERARAGRSVMEVAPEPIRVMRLDAYKGDGGVPVSEAGLEGEGVSGGVGGAEGQDCGWMTCPEKRERPGIETCGVV